MNELLLDDVQLVILRRLLQGDPINQAEKREMITVVDDVEALIDFKGLDVDDDE